MTQGKSFKEEEEQKLTAKNAHLSTVWQYLDVPRVYFKLNMLQNQIILAPQT